MASQLESFINQCAVKQEFLFSLGDISNKYGYVDMVRLHDNVFDNGKCLNIEDPHVYMPEFIQAIKEDIIYISLNGIPNSPAMGYFIALFDKQHILTSRIIYGSERVTLSHVHAFNNAGQYRNFVERYKEFIVGEATYFPEGQKQAGFHIPHSS